MSLPFFALLSFFFYINIQLVKFNERQMIFFERFTLAKRGAKERGECQLERMHTIQTFRKSFPALLSSHTSPHHNDERWNLIFPSRSRKRSCFSQSFSSLHPATVVVVVSSAPLHFPLNNAYPSTKKNY